MALAEARGLLLVLLVVHLLGGVAHAESPRAAVLLDEDEEQADKKSRWLAEKAARVEHPVPPPAASAEQPLSLRNMWTDEVLPLSSSMSGPEAQAAFDRLLRCHYTQASTHMATPLLGVVRAAAQAFHAPVVELVSGYRAPKYQLMLRKKGHEVARDSAHPRGEAVDFRLPAVPTQKLLAFVRKHRLGGIGYYPQSRFVHIDVGPIRSWRGH